MPQYGARAPACPAHVCACTTQQRFANIPITPYITTHCRVGWRRAVLATWPVWRLFAPPELEGLLRHGACRRATQHPVPTVSSDPPQAQAVAMRPSTDEEGWGLQYPYIRKHVVAAQAPSSGSGRFGRFTGLLPPGLFTLVITT